MTEDRYIGRSVDYLGTIAAKLRDLTGFASLAHELIQNADDAPEASKMWFDIGREALVVDNDGLFSDCGHAEEAACPWKQERGHLCDFHRFRKVASGDKQDEAGTIGAFGVGFIAVYQITDHPELISGERHWILREEHEQGKNIRVCSGCHRCRATDLPGTRFILPWARDPDSPLRRALRVGAVQNGDPGRLLQDLKATLPTSMLFLRKISRIEVREEGIRAACFERLPEGEDLIVTDGQQTRIWHLIHGSFEPLAAELRTRYPLHINQKLTAEVVLAVPEEADQQGVFCAFLPTQQSTGLPFHIQADFFTSSDRKRIVLESGYQGEWNRAAICGAAEALAESLERLRGRLELSEFWKLLQSLRVAAQQADGPGATAPLGEFWRRAAPRLRELPIIRNTRKEWCRAQDVLLLEEKDEESAIAALEELGLSLVDPALRPFYNLLRELGVGLLDLPEIVAQLKHLGLIKRTAGGDVPAALRSRSNLQALWRELGILLRKSRQPNRQQELERELKDCALALGRDGVLWPWKDVYQADDDTCAIFAAIDASIPFLADLGPEGEQLQRLCRAFSARAAVERLGRLGAGALERARREGRLNPSALLRWFEQRSSEVMREPETLQGLVQLPIFPSSAGLRPLQELALPGNFEDPIGLAQLVDLKVLSGRTQFLKDLGASELTFEHYVVTYLPVVFGGGGLATEQKRQVVHLLAQHMGELRDSREDVQAILADLEIIECEDGVFRTPDEAYLPSGTVKSILGLDAHVAALPAKRDAIHDLYRWLGVADKPRYRDIVQRVYALMQEPPNAASRQAVGEIFAHLGQRLTQSDKDKAELEVLKSCEWLPVRGDAKRWYAPREVHAIFRDYLFESQGKFLDIPREVQTDCRRLLDFLAIRTEPDVAQVVAHLRCWSKTGRAVNKEVFRFLNDHADDPAVKALRGTPCLLLADSTYVKPEEVFWGEHPFGNRRHRLGQDMVKYLDLLNSLGVRKRPEAADALAVLREISDEYSEFHQPLSQDAKDVLMACWRMLDEALGDGRIAEDDLVKLRAVPVVPDARGVLNPPEVMFFDDRAGLAAKFGLTLANNVIERIQGAWKAMQAAGVRSLREEARRELLECEERGEDESIARRIRERRDELARVLAGHCQDHEVQSHLRVLGALHWIAASKLTIRYTLSAFKREWYSEPEDVTVLWQPADTMYVVHRDGETPWPSIARELALMLFPDLEPGRVSPGLSVVLGAPTSDQARYALDELGLARLIVLEPGEAPPTSIIEDLGGAESTASDEETPGPAGPEEAPPTEGEGVRTPEAAVKAILGDAAQPPAPPPAPDQRVAQPPAQPGRERSKQRGRLRTYVLPAGQEPATEEPEVAERRSAVEQAGIRRALEYERQGGRVPQEMPVHHRGYDIESRDDSGQVVRYIEVKATSQAWGETGVGLSRSQFDTAAEKGDRYWLYVVEQAEDDDATLYAIQDPARRAEQFLYDRGWSDLAENER